MPWVPLFLVVYVSIPIGSMVLIYIYIYMLTFGVCIYIYITYMDMFFLSYLVLAPKLRTDGHFQSDWDGRAPTSQPGLQCFQHVSSTNNRIPTSTAQSRCIPAPSRSRSDRNISLSG